MPDSLALSGEFLNIWSIRVAVWSVILVDLVIICSRECVKQNSKYDLVRWGIYLLAVFTGLCLKISLFLGCKFTLISPRRWHSWDSKTLVLLNVRSRQFTKSYLSGGLYKIPIRTGLDLGSEISIKILCINAKIRFPIIWNIVFNKTSYTSSFSELVRSYQVISFYLKSTAQNCVVKLNFT